MKCKCGADASLRTADHGYGYGAEYECSDSYRAHGNPYGHRFLVDSEEAKRESSAAFAESRANAEALRRRFDNK